MSRRSLQEVRAARLHFLQEFIEVIRDVMKGARVSKRLEGLLWSSNYSTSTCYSELRTTLLGEIHDSLWVKS
jgi:hypothetical protein